MNGYTIFFFVLTLILNIFIVHFEAKFVIFPEREIKN